MSGFPSPLLRPPPTPYWYPFGGIECLVAPVAGWADETDSTRAGTLLCQLSRGELAIMSWYAQTTPLPQALPTSYTAEECLLQLEAQAQEWAQVHHLPPPSPVPDLNGLAEKTLCKRAPLGAMLHEWARQPRSALGANLEKPDAWEAISRTAAQVLESWDGGYDAESDVALRLAEALHEGVIPFPGVGLQRAREVDALVGLLAPICENLQDGPAELVQLLTSNAPLAKVCAPLLKALPHEHLADQQAVLDEFFRTKHSWVERQSALQLDAGVYAGVLPPRYSLAMLLEDLLVPCLSDFKKWAESAR